MLSSLSHENIVNYHSSWLEINIVDDEEDETNEESYSGWASSADEKSIKKNKIKYDDDSTSQMYYSKSPDSFSNFKKPHNIDDISDSNDSTSLSNNRKNKFFQDVTDNFSSFSSNADMSFSSVSKSGKIEKIETSLSEVSAQEIRKPRQKTKSTSSNREKIQLFYTFR